MTANHVDARDWCAARSPYRAGVESGITFTGCSCVLSLREPRVVAMMGPEDVVRIPSLRSKRKSKPKVKARSLYPSKVAAVIERFEHRQQVM